METTLKVTGHPYADAKRKALELNCGHDIRVYKDGTVGLYTNDFKPFIFKLSWRS